MATQKWGSKEGKKNYVVFYVCICVCVWVGVKLQMSEFSQFIPEASKS